MKNPVRTVHRWLRAVQPPLAFVAIATIGSIVWEALYAITGWFGQWINPADYFRSRDMVLVFCALVCGIFRVRAFHPVLDTEYYLWLVRTPWVRGKPLPRGPVHLVPQDLLFIVFLLLLRAFHPALPWSVFPLVFLLGYLISLAWSLWLTGQAAAAYGTLFFMGLAIHCLRFSPLAALGVSSVAYCLAVSAYWQSLLKFPWYDALTAAMQTIRRLSASFQLPPAATTEPAAIAALAELPALWPYGVLHHRRLRRTLSTFDAWALGLLAGWWISAMLAALPNPPAELCYLLVGFPVLACILIRLYRYRAGHASPISFSGRFWTGRWIIPAYDRVFLAPLAVLFTAAGLPPVLWSLHVPLAAIAGITTSLVMLVTLLAPPPLRHWQLTAPVRLRPLASKAPQTGVAEI